MDGAGKSARGEPCLGDYTDLYETLLPEQVRNLELAIYLRRIRRFKDALHIFEHKLPPAHTAPVLAIEHSTLYVIQGLDSLAVKLLMKTMTWRGKWLEKALGNELELLRILCAEFEIRNGGKLKAALAQARKSKEIISSQSIDTYTDIEVSLNCGNGHTLLSRVSGGNYPCILQNIEQSPVVVQLG